MGERSPLVSEPTTYEPAVALVEQRFRGALYGDWPGSVRRFVRLGLTLDEIDDAVTITNAYGRGNYWRFFCGVCWRKLRADGRYQERSPAS
jgi:hypothetical protein